MNFRFFDDLVNSAPGATQEFGFRKRNIKQKNTQQNLLKFFWEILIFKNVLVKFKKNQEKI